jgi:ABC-type polysaccharide/polyol phosphate export permease
MAVSVGFLGGLYGALLKMNLQVYVPFLALGLLVWGYMQGVIIDGCTVFMQSEHFIKQIRLPITTFVFRVVCKNLITLGHTALVYVIVAIVFQVNPGWNGLLFIPALLLLIANSVWVVLLLGVICTRFRDVPNIVQSLLQVVFFVTPILWTPQLLGRRAYLVDLNPIHHFVELVRSPLLGEVPSALTWEVAGGITVGGFALTFLMFTRYRNRIAFWL